ncbi:MAG: AAA family ATPase [Longimicrobiales bacterium]|jgi:MoxR-like ATPase|nr:MoxR family ATPase [Longimicrobiales bacterium]|tara:strand:- start:426 stop:1427 length:1002 start_codon:yes stop_codon:yes gene_type:complete
MSETKSLDIEVIQQKIEQESAFVDRLLAEVGRVIVGQQTMVQRLLIGMLADGHVLMEGVPGLAKTLTVKTLAEAIDTKFRRLQFTPDLLPADLIGTLIYDPKDQEFKTKKGPIFANIILADEINRSPAKVQAALLEAMQERQVTIGEHSYPLDDPFLVLATQNPIEQEGTYPLPEAQIDRFMLKLSVEYPTGDEELQIMRRMSAGGSYKVKPVVKPDEILRARAATEMIYMDSQVERYIVDLILATRDPAAYGLKDLTELISYGASPRATICLAKTARAHAFLQRRGFVTPDDVRAMGMDVLRHRVLVTYEAEAEEVTPEDIVRRILDQVEVP